MYKVLKIEKYYDETFFTLKNLETGTEIRCFEMDSYDELKEFHFIQESGMYECLIKIDVDIKANKESESDKYYKILELNTKIGDYKFAKLELNKDVYYVLMDYLKEIQNLENKEKILLRRIDYHLLKVDDVVSETFKRDEEYEKELPKLLAKAIEQDNKEAIKLCNLALRNLKG